MQEIKNLAEYPPLALGTAFYSKGNGREDLLYLAMGLCGESGEVTEKFKKVLRDKDGAIDKHTRLLIAKELGDCLWYLTALCDFYKITLDNLLSHKIAPEDHGYSIYDMSLGLSYWSGKIGKRLSGIKSPFKISKGLTSEMASMLDYISSIAYTLGLSVVEIAQINLTKLQDRKDRNVLGGSGDNR